MCAGRCFLADWLIFLDHETIHRKVEGPADYRVKSEESDVLSADLRKRGFKFVGTTTMYSFLAECGMVNDHDTTCFKRVAQP
jgi:DNA-3-methyladenine glycosylase I